MWQSRKPKYTEIERNKKEQGYRYDDHRLRNTALSNTSKYEN